MFGSITIKQTSVDGFWQSLTADIFTPYALIKKITTILVSSQA